MVFGEKEEYMSRFNTFIVGHEKEFEEFVTTLLVNSLCMLCGLRPL